MEQYSEKIGLIDRSEKERAVSFIHAILIFAVAYMLLVCVIGTMISDDAYPLLLMIGVCALFSITLIIGLLSGARPNAHAIAALVFGLLQGAYVWINGVTFFPLYCVYHLLILSYAYFTLALFDRHNRTVGGGLLLLDLVKAAFVYPFVSFTAWFRTLFIHGKRNQKVGKSVLFTLIGIAAALILGAIVAMLLSFDPYFKKVITIRIDWDDAPLVILRLLFAVPLSAMLFSAFTSSKDNRVAGISARDTARNIATKMKKLPAVTLLLPVAALLVIYGLFFFSQWDTYMSAFSGVLPASFTAAEYARNGFFELCAVAFINAALGITMSLFMKDNSAVSVLLRKVANTLLSLCTLILIATALSKMILYIQRFDLTVLRLLTSVILIVIAIGFLVSLLSQWIKRIKVTPVLAVCAALILLVLPFLNVRGQIARYNVDSYLSHSGERNIDIDYLVYDLGRAGTPDAVRLLDSGKLPEEKQKMLERLLNSKRRFYENNNDPLSMTLADYRAIQALNESESISKR